MYMRVLFCTFSSFFIVLFFLLILLWFITKACPSAAVMKEFPVCGTNKGNFDSDSDPSNLYQTESDLICERRCVVAVQPITEPTGLLSVNEVLQFSMCCDRTCCSVSDL